MAFSCVKGAICKVSKKQICVASCHATNTAQVVNPLVRQVKKTISNFLVRVVQSHKYTLKLYIYVYIYLGIFVINKLLLEILEPVSEKFYQANQANYFAVP